MLKKRILSLLLITLIAISSIGCSSAWLTFNINNDMEPNHKSLKVDYIRMYSDYEGHDIIYQVKDPHGFDKNTIGMVSTFPINFDNFGRVKRIKFSTHHGKDVNIYLNYPDSNTIDKKKIVNLDLCACFAGGCFYENLYWFHFYDKYNYGIQDFKSKNVVVDCSNDVVSYIGGWC